MESRGWALVVVVVLVVLVLAAWITYDDPHAARTGLKSIREYRSSPVLSSRLWADRGGRDRELSPSGRDRELCPGGRDHELYANRGTEHTATLDELAHTQFDDVVWIRMSSPNAWTKLGVPLIRESDLDTFVARILPHRTTPFVLVTTDGDRSVPSEYRSATAHAVLAHPLCRHWYTQNFDGTCRNPKMSPIPIGLDFHSPRAGTVEQFRSAMASMSPPESRQLRIWSDCHLKDNPLRFGDPRGRFRSIVPRLLHLDVPQHRVPVTEIWRTYSRYAFVVSLPGNGWDCHRTWEALYLGATVLTTPVPFRALFEGYRVVELPLEQWVDRLNDPGWLRTTHEDMSRRPAFADTPDQWRTRFRCHL